MEESASSSGGGGATYELKGLLLEHGGPEIRDLQVDAEHLSSDHMIAVRPTGIQTAQILPFVPPKSGLLPLAAWPDSWPIQSLH